MGPAQCEARQVVSNEFPKSQPASDESTILRVVTKQMVPGILLFGLYVQFHGDYGPGGGFQAGVIFASGVVLYTLVFGLEQTRRAVSPLVLMRLAPMGVLLYAGTGLVSLLQGRAFLDYAALNPEHPSHGQHWGILLVELGVGITVASVMILVFYSFAGRGRRIGRG